MLSVSSEIVEVVAGSNVSLTCSAIGLDLPNITWSMPVTMSGRATISHMIINDTYIASQLDIFDTEQADTGNYSCTAENSISNDTGYIFLQILGVYSTYHALVRLTH